MSQASPVPYPYTMTTATSSPVNTYWVTVMPARPPETKEQKKERLKRERRAIRSKKWYDRAMARADKWFADEMVKIEAECKANEWRPRVSNHSDNNFALAWWSLGKAGVDEFTGWRRERSRYMNKWCGITITNISYFERAAIRTFVSSLHKRDVYHTGNQSFDDHDGAIGPHMSQSTGYWFRNLDDHNRFVEMLKALPPRAEGALIANVELTPKVEARIKRKLTGRNYMIVHGSNGESVLTIPDDDISALSGVFDKILGVKMLIGQ